MKTVFYNALFIAKGMFTTLELLVFGIMIGIVLSILASIARYKGVAAFLINRLISVLRGTPLILQLALMYFAVPSVTGIKFEAVTAGIITFGLNSTAYIAEILRAGIESIPKEQFEAAQTLNIPTYAMWKDIIFPQVIKNILPAMINEIISLLKETALIATIGGMDIMRSAQIIAAEQFTYFTPLCIAGIYYYLLVLMIEYSGKVLERKMDYVNH